MFDVLHFISLLLAMADDKPEPKNVSQIYSKNVKMSLFGCDSQPDQDSEEGSGLSKVAWLACVCV